MAVAGLVVAAGVRRVAAGAAGQPSELRVAVTTTPPPPPEAPGTAATAQANPPGDVRDNYTVVPDVYMYGVWTPVTGPFATAKEWCDYYDGCRGFSQQNDDDQYWWLGTGDFSGGETFYPAAGYTTYLKPASGGASGASDASAAAALLGGTSGVP